MADRIQGNNTENVGYHTTSRQATLDECQKNLDYRSNTNASGGSSEVAHSQQKKENKFQQTVRRHLGKDRLFHLVTTLLKTIDEETRAQNDLIQSFQTARNIKIDIPSSNRANNDVKPRRRRKKMEIPLAERIETLRKTKGESNAQVKENVLMTNEIVGKLELSPKHSTQKTRDNSVYSEEHCDGDEVQNCSVYHITATARPDSINGPGDVCNGYIKDEGADKLEMESVIIEKTNIDGNKQRSIPRTALTSEKEAVVNHFRNTNDNFDLDKLVLDSVLENICLSNNSEKIMITDTDTKAESAVVSNTDEGHNVEANFQVVVETDSDASDDELQTDVKGNCDILEDIFEVSNDRNTINNNPRYQNGDNDDFEMFLAENARVTSSAYSRMPSTMIKPRLGTIAEAEYSGSSLVKSSDNIIEIEINKTTMDKFNKSVNTSEQETPQYKVPSMKRPTPNSKIRLSSSRENADDTDRKDITSNNTPMKEPSKLLYIDLLDVYEGNKELQAINNGHLSKSKRSILQTKNHVLCSKTKEGLSSKTNNRKKSKSGVSVSAKSSHEYPTSIKHSNHITTFHLSDEHSVQPATKPIEQFRRYVRRKDAERYTTPDMILLNRLRILETAPRNEYAGNTERKTETFAQNDRKSCVNDYSAVRNSSSRKARSSRKLNIWSMPLHEAVKSVGHMDKIKIPPLQAMHDSRPRQQRVHAFYAEFQKDREDNGSRQCKYLDLSPRTESTLY